jgi:hypothetical protein
MMRYARGALDLKRQALSQVFPYAPALLRGGHLLLDGKDLVGCLRRIQRKYVESSCGLT